MADIKITTNNVPRDVLSGHDLTESERTEFDYRDWSEPDGDGWTADYARYHGQVYDLNDTEGNPQFAPEWDMHISHTFFSGVLFRYPRDEFGTDTEHVIIGTYYVS